MNAVTTPATDLGRRPGRRTSRFGALVISWDDHVLRPRPWTTRQSLWAADLLVTAPPGRVLELCCGAGQIGLLAVAASARQLVAVDASEAACELARHNARAAGMAGRVEVRHGDLADALAPDERFALVMADPPYLPTRDVARYPEDPPTAIDGGTDGTALVWPCLDVVRDHLDPRGTALVQLRNDEQARRVTDALAADGDLSVLEERNLGGGVVVRIGRR